MGSFNTTLFHLFIFSLISMLALAAAAAPLLSNETDRQALLAFKSQIYDDPRKAALDSWNDSLHFCDWRGITCGRRHRQRVVGMNLSYFHLSGRFSPHIGNLSFLATISLSNNGFHGEIPRELGRLPRLVSIDFSFNSLEGSIPDALSNCSRLQYILLFRNILAGVPLELGLLSELSALDLGGNKFTGVFPVFLTNLSSLVVFSLSSNSFHGSIPEQVGKLSKLQQFGLGNNSFSGELPPAFYNLSNIRWLSIFKNQLSGSFSPDISYFFPNIELFTVFENHFNDLSDNSLVGNLPSDIGQLQNLNSFNVSHNKLSGRIPGSLGNCKSLVSLNMSFNSFEGSIPVTLEALSAAEIVDLSSNHLNGSIPLYFTNFRAIQVLNLSFNALRGEVPLKGPFTNASKISVLGNSELCGGIVELHLPPCPKLNVERDHHHKNMRPSLLKIIIPCSIGIIILFLASCYSSVSCWTKRSRNIVLTVLSSSMKKQYMQITYAELHRATNGFSVDNLIGSGSFGSVFKGLLSDSNGQMDIAVKVINIVEQASLRGFVSECEALKKIRHRNVVRILTSCSSLDFQGNDFKALVFKFMKNGSLDSWLHPNSGQDLYLSFVKRLDVAIDVANALDYLHNQCDSPIIHCDLKPGNILLDEDMVAQVSDFGLAKVLLSAQDNSSSYASMLKGSIGYIPPEYGERYEVTPKGDVYSYGVLLLEMFMGRRPNHEMFKDGLTISKHAETEHRERLIGIVDPRMMQNENFENHPMLEACFSSIIEVAVSCTSNLPQMRKNVSVVCSELQAARAAYHDWRHGRITFTM